MRGIEIELTTVPYAVCLFGDPTPHVAMFDGVPYVPVWDEMMSTPTVELEFTLNNRADVGKARQLLELHGLQNDISFITLPDDSSNTPIMRVDTRSTRLSEIRCIMTPQERIIDVLGEGAGRGFLISESGEGVHGLPLYPLSIAISTHPIFGSARRNIYTLKAPQLLTPMPIDTISVSTLQATTGERISSLAAPELLPLAGNMFVYSYTFTITYVTE